MGYETLEIVGEGGRREVRAELVECELSDAEGGG